MTGRVVLVVGPSGVGKDTLLAGARGRVDALFPRRVITRDPEAGGEDYEPVSVAEFARRREAGAFAFHWGAHGLFYGIPAEAVAEAARRDVIFNASRGIIPEVRAKHPRRLILSVEAPREVLAARLAGRGRESAADIAARLARDVRRPDGPDVRHIDNSGPPEDGIARFLAALA